MTPLTLSLVLSHQPEQSEENTTPFTRVVLPLRQPRRICAIVVNGDPANVHTATLEFGIANTVTVNLEFGWAKFGMGIPFSTTGMSPNACTVTLSPGVTWTHVLSGHQRVRVLLSDPDDLYEPQESMRNVDVVERPPCGKPQVFYVTVYNDESFTQTVDVGMMIFDVPATWQVSTVPSDTLELGPDSEGTIEVHVVIPCPSSLQLVRATREIYAIQEKAGSVPTVDVEGYIDGVLVGGIELRFEAPAEQDFYIYLPMVLKVWQ